MCKLCERVERDRLRVATGSGLVAAHAPRCCYAHLSPLCFHLVFVFAQNPNKMSSDLIWQVVRKDNSFLRSSNGVTLSLEPNNVANVNSFKFSGLANAKTVGVTVENKRVVMTTRHGGAQRVKNTQKATILRSRVNKKQAGAEAARQLTANSHYRSDLTNYAIARYHALNRSLKLKATPAARVYRGRRGNKAQ